MGIRYWAVFAFTSALGLTGCGGDEQSSQSSTTYKGTIAAISTDSTITINSDGQALTFDMTDVTVDSDSDSELSPGKVVTVEGSHDGVEGHADNIEYDSDVEGYVTAISTATDGTVTALDVMGQIVIVDEMTMYGDGLSAAVDIKVNDLIEVSGVFQDDHSILAKHIEYKTRGDIEIKGLVTELVTTGGVTTFKIGTCTITVNAQTEFQDMGTAADLIAGMEVEVHSNVDAGSTMVDMTSGCNVIASKIELEDAREEAREFEFERGEVVSELLDGKFTITVKHDLNMTTDIVVIVNEATALGGGGLGDIAVGAMLHVQGNYDVDGYLVAKEIEFKPVS